jgi:glycerate kinase
MRVLVAADGFKDSLSSTEAAAAIGYGWRSGAPGDEVDEVSLSDGGPGFIDALASSIGGRRVSATARDPLGRSVGAQLLLNGDSAYVESAQACGLHLVEPPERRPELESTAGVGDLVAAAIAAGATRVIVGLGGSATNDGGAGLLGASGVVFRDRSGRPVQAIPARLHALHHVELPHGWRPSAELVAAADVDNPLLGPDGATAVYGLQKGVRPEDAALLEAALAHLAGIVGRDVPGAAGLEHRPGAGAAGGLGYGLLVLGASRRSGIDLVLDATHLGGRIARADLVITGEGSFDQQSFHGKVVSGVARLARAAGIPCIVLAGRVAVPAGDLEAHAITAAYSASEEAGSEAASLAEPARYLSALATRVARRTRA